MPSWITESAKFNRLVPGRAYSRSQAAEAMAVSAPRGPRDWGGIVPFRNGTALFVTLEKDPKRFAIEHRYSDRFESNLMYWDSRATHSKESRQVVVLCETNAVVVAFARVREKVKGKTEPFFFLGRVVKPDFWGEQPVHFTWELQEFPDGLSGSSELYELAEWAPPLATTLRPKSTTGVRQSASEKGQKAFPEKMSEGSRTKVFVNRYERDYRARDACIAAHRCRCYVCDFDFEIAYGALGSGFIFVHHRIPLSVRARAGAYEFDPVRDLVPVCGNCHAMVHRRISVDVFKLSLGLSIPAAERLKELRNASLDPEWVPMDV